MARMEKCCLIFILLILAFQASSGRREIAKDGTEPVPIPAYLSSTMEARRTLMEFVLDYDYGGHNIKHEHMKGRPGTGSRNP